MISHRRSGVLLDDQTLDVGIALFTTVVTRPDPEQPVSALELLQEWMSQDGSDLETRPGSIRYSVLSILVAFYVLIRSGRTVSVANMTKALLLETTDAQRDRLGMTVNLAGTRADTIAAGLADDCDDQAAKRGRVALTREYARVHKVLAAVCDTIDPSPYAKGHKLTNETRDAIRDTPDHPDRRIDLATEARHRSRMDDFLNTTVAASAADAPTDDYLGDLATDETIVLSLGLRPGHGLKSHHRRALDPDAEWWSGKTDDDPDKGFGYGVTLAIRMQHPYARRIPQVAVGIHIGRPTGGRVEAFAVAHRGAQDHGLLKEGRNRQVVADMGYTKLLGWVPYLLDHGYRVNADYPRVPRPRPSSIDLGVEPDDDLDEDSRPYRDRPVRDHDVEGEPTLGPRIIAGRIRCPGAAGLPAEAMISARTDKTRDTVREILDRTQRVDYLDAHAMPIKESLRRAKSSTRGRPRNDEDGNSFCITVQCPAVLGRVNCANAPLADGTRLPGVPDVFNPPYPDEPHRRPRACRQDVVTYRLDVREIKWLQADTWGSHVQQDMYESMRSANERFHSQLKSAGSGGVDGVPELRGIARNGLMFAIAVAVTNHNLISDFRTKHMGNDGKATFGPRETERRRRQKLIRDSKAA